MGRTVWLTSSDGTIEFVSLTSEFLEETLAVMKKSFYPYESACVAVGLPQYPEAIPELEELTIRTAKDGMSIIAVEVKSQKVVGAAFNKLQVKHNPSEGTYFENYSNSCKYASSKGVVRFMMDADAVCDLYEYCNIDCLLEIMFLATLPGFQKRGIARQLCQASTEAATSLLKGTNIKHSIDGTQLMLKPVPKIISALFTGPYSQKIGRTLNWEIAARISYDNFFHEGKTFSSVLGKDIPDTTLEFKKL